MLDLEVTPARSLRSVTDHWEFILGMPFYQAVNIIRKHDRIIKDVDIWYSEQTPLQKDLKIKLTNDGIRLIFDCRTQRLKIIEVYNMRKVKLRYFSNHFNSDVVSPTIEEIDRSFGATHPGEYNPEKRLFILNFRGISFHFNIESQYQLDDITALQHKQKQNVAAFQHSNGQSPIVSSMYIYTGKSFSETYVPEIPNVCFINNVFLESISVARSHNATKAFKFSLITESNAAISLADDNKVTCERMIHFGDSCQDVAGALGSPVKIYYKEEDKMRIHARDYQRYVNDKVSDYFYNYVTLGVDILFDGTSHTVKKIILHTNYPGHYDFNMYYRCNFTIPVEVDASDENTDQTSLSPGLIHIKSDTKWSSIKDSLLHPTTKPVVLNRTSSTNTTNPFGPTWCYGIQDMIFEVMKNDHIASVTLYQAKTS